MGQSMSTPVKLSIAGAITAACLVAAANADARLVSSVQELDRALKFAAKNEVISLAPGVYDSIDIKNFHGNVTLTSADPAHRAVIHSLSVSDSSGITFDNLDFVASPLPSGKLWQGGMAFHLYGVSYVTLRNLEVHSEETTSWERQDGGIGIAASEHVVIADNDFHDLHAGIGHGDSFDLIIQRNKLHHLLDDGIRGGGSSHVVIDSNHCWSNHYIDKDEDHPDCIQFWTSNTHGPTHDLWIENNSYERGDGEAVQGIWLNDEGLQHYERVFIRGNHLHGAQWNGIVITGGKSVHIEDNVVCAGAGQDSWIGAYDSTDVTMRFNRAYLLRTDHSTGLDVRNNKIEPCK